MVTVCTDHRYVEHTVGNTTELRCAYCGKPKPFFRRRAIFKPPVDRQYHGQRILKGEQPRGDN